jgi:ParB family chromosome partitioning protein
MKWMSEREFRILPIELIVSSETPSRQVYEGISALAATIQRHGLIHPIVVKKDIQRGYTVLVGERRLRACQRAGLSHVPCLVVKDDLTEDQVLEMQLVENLQRRDLKVFEEVRLVETLRDRFGLSHEEIAVKTGLSHGTVENYLAIARLPEEYLRMIERDSHSVNELTITKALVLAQANLPADKLRETVELIRRKGLTRTQLAKKLAKDRPSKVQRVHGSRRYWRELTRTLRDYARYWSDYAKLKEWETTSHYHMLLEVSLPKDLREEEEPLELRGGNEHA